MFCVGYNTRGFNMDKKVGLSIDEKRAILLGIFDNRTKKEVAVNIESRDYILHQSRNNKDKYVITVYNNKHYVVKCNDVVIADSDTFGNNVVAKRDIEALVNKFIDIYNKELVNKAYGKQR